MILLYMLSSLYIKQIQRIRQRLQKPWSGEKKHEIVIKGCTWKGNKAGHGGKVANYFVAISLGKGICYCKHYEKLSEK